MNTTDEKETMADTIIAGEVEEFLATRPKCREFTEIFHYLRALDISEDVAASVAKSLLWAERRGGAGGKYQRKFTDAQFLSLFSEKAGASCTGLCKEAETQFGMSQVTFYRFLQVHEKTGAVVKMPSGLWRLAKQLP